MKNKSKFKSASLLALVYCGLQLPAAADNYDTWTKLYDAFWWEFFDVLNIRSIGMSNDISANANSWLSNSSIGTVFHLNGHTLTGCGGDSAVFWTNIGSQLTVNGGTIHSNDSTQSSIVNWGDIRLIDVAWTMACSSPMTVGVTVPIS